LWHDAGAHDEPHALMEWATHATSGGAAGQANGAATNVALDAGTRRQRAAALGHADALYALWQDHPDDARVLQRAAAAGHSNALDVLITTAGHDPTLVSHYQHVAAERASDARTVCDPVAFPQVRPVCPACPRRYL
jgi:hypothetical protein